MPKKERQYDDKSYSVMDIHFDNYYDDDDNDLEIKTVAKEEPAEEYIDHTDIYIKYSNAYTSVKEYCECNGLAGIFDRCTREQFMNFCIAHVSENNL